MRPSYLKGAISAFLVFLSPCFGAFGTAHADDDGIGVSIEIEKAVWRAVKQRLNVVGGQVPARAVVVMWDAASNIEIGRTKANSEGRWRFRITSPDRVPCRVRVSNGDETVEKQVKKAPKDCNSEGGEPTQNVSPEANAGPDQTLNLAVGTSNVDVTLNASGSTDAESSILSYSWSGTPKPASVEKPVVSLGAGM